MRIEEAVPLAPRTTLGVGGPARYLARADTETEVCEALRWAQGRGLPVTVLGGGSNVVIADEGLDGLVLAVNLHGAARVALGNDVELRACAGEPWDALVASSVAQNLQGLECLSGIPGLVGATPIQNVGAYGQDVSETIVSVRAIERKSLTIREFSGTECRFSYRSSLFKSQAPGDFVITEVRYRLRPGAPPKVGYADLERALAESGSDAPTLADVRKTVLAVRRSKSMVLDAGDENGRSCGSFFTNPIVDDGELPAIEGRAGETRMPRFPQNNATTKLSAAWLIERAGFAKGTRDGAVGLSTRHALALVCHDGAQASDVTRFATKLRQGVLDRFGVKLEPEPVFWGFSGNPLPWSTD